jgi:hypothetical protein
VGTETFSQIIPTDVKTEICQKDLKDLRQWPKPNFDFEGYIFGLSNEFVVNYKNVLGPLTTMKLSKYYFYDSYPEKYNSMPIVSQQGNATKPR